MISMESIRKLSDSYRNIQEAEADVSKIIKDLGDDLAGSNEDQMRGVQLIKGLALSDDPKANEFMQKLDKATSQISKEMSEGYGYSDNPKKKKVKTKLDEGYFKIDIPQMPPTYIESPSAASVKASLRVILKPDALKEMTIEKVSKGEMKKQLRDMAKEGGEVKEEIETVEESKSLIDLLNNIKNGGKIEDTDLTEEDVNGILDFYENTLDETGQKEFNKMSITKIQSTMKKLGL